MQRFAGPMQHSAGSVPHIFEPYAIIGPA